MRALQANERARPRSTAAGVAYAGMCEADGEHLHQGLLQHESRFHVQLRDSNGQRLRRGGDRLRVTARGPGPLRPVVTDCGDGRYEVTYLATLSGSYSVSITCNTVPIRGSPFSLLVEPSCAHAPCCTIEGEDIETIVAGDRARFSVRAYDENGRAKIMGGECFEALLVRRRARRDAAPSPPSSPSRPPLQQPGDDSPRQARAEESASSWVDEALAEEARWLARRRPADEGGAAGPAESVDAIDTYGSRSPRAQAAGVSSVCSPGGHGRAVELGDSVATSPLPLRPGNDTGVSAQAAAAQQAAHRIGGAQDVGMSVSLHDQGNGRYSGAFTVTRSGAYLLHVRREGVPVKGSPLAVTVLQAPSFAPLCALRGDGLRMAVAGQPASFTVESFDRFGNSRRDVPQDQQLRVQLVPRRQAATPNRVADDANASGTALGGTVGGPPAVAVTAQVKGDAAGAGVYVASYVVGIAGEYEVQLKLGSEPLPQRPVVSVLPAETSARCCVAQGEGLSTGVAGERAIFVIFARDAFGNARDCGGDPFVVRLHQPSTRRSATMAGEGGAGVDGPETLVGDSVDEVTGEVSRCSDGSAAASFVPTNAGSAQLQVTLGGEHIAGSPFATRVEAAHARGACSSAVGGGLSLAVAGELAELTVSTRDAFGNRAPPASPPQLRLRGAGGNTGGDPSAAMARVDVEGGADGVYRASWSCEVCGDYLLDVLVAAEHIAGSPFRVSVLPAPAHAQACRLVAAGAPALHAGHSTVLRLECRDRFGNRCTGGGDAIRATLKRERADVVAAQMEVAAARGVDPDELGESNWGDEACGEPIASSGTGEVPLPAERVLQRPPPPTVLDEGGGFYALGYGSCVVGSLQLHLYLGEQTILAPPMSLRVLPAEPCVRHSFCRAMRGTAPATIATGVDKAEDQTWRCASGENVQVAMWLRDAYGNACEARLDGLRLHLRGAQEVEGSVHLTSQSHQLLQLRTVGNPASSDDAAGLYAVAAPQLAGHYYAHVTMHGEELGGSPLSLHVRPAPALALACEVWGDGLQHADAGVPAFFMLRLRDAASNLTDDGVAHVSARLLPPMAGASAAEDDAAGADEGPGAAASVLAAPCGSKSDAPAEQGAPAPGGMTVAKEGSAPAGGSVGRCSVALQSRGKGPARGSLVCGSLCSLEAGCHLLHLRLGGISLGQSPYRVHVTPAPAHPAACSLIVAAEVLRAARPGVPLSFRVTTRDRYGNACDASGDEPHVFVRGVARPSQQELAPHGGGEYRLTVTLPLSGEYEVHVSVRKQQVIGSPVSVSLPLPQLDRPEPPGQSSMPRLTSHANSMSPPGGAAIQQHSPTRRHCASPMGSASPHRHGSVPHYASPIERHHTSPRQHGTPRHHPSPLLRAQSAPHTHRPRLSELQIPSPSPSRAVLAGTYPSPPHPSPPRPAGASPAVDKPADGTTYANADLASAEVRLSREAYAGAAATALRDANSATAWAAPVAPPCNDPEVPLATEKPKSTADIGVAEADAELVDADTAYAALCARFGGDLSVEHLASLPREQVQALSAVLHDRHTTRHD